MAEIRHLENRHDVIFFCRGRSDLDKISQTGTEWHVDCGDVWKWKPCRIPIWRTFGRIRWHVISEPVSHCRVLPLGEFTVTIPESHATLQGAVTWRNQCRDRAKLQGVIIPSGYSPYYGILICPPDPLRALLMFVGLWVWTVRGWSSCMHTSL